MNPKIPVDVLDPCAVWFSVQPRAGHRVSITVPEQNVSPITTENLPAIPSGMEADV